MTHLHSEDDIRTKVVTSWLLDHGVSPRDIQIEFSFTIRFGRTEFTVGRRNRTTPRADVLVKRTDGHNLLIVEVKAPKATLDDEARDQGISYARGVAQGNMPPFVVVTNGLNSQIFDTLTKHRLDGTSIPIDHPHVMAGFSISGDDLSLRAEALELLVSLSQDNLLQFCEAQSQLHMRRLRSDHLHSGKKYTPSLYVERPEASARLHELLEDERRNVVLVVGPPQVGKTNFVCHEVERRIAAGQPTLFYPAIGMNSGLASEIAEDFGWLLGDTGSSSVDVYHKLRRVVARSQDRLVIFVDGWNEATSEIARAIDRDGERASSSDVQLVVSLTNTAASRLLKDAAGNPGFLAEAALVPSHAAELIKLNADVKPRERGWSVVNISRFSQEESRLAYRKYGSAYNVRVPSEHRHTCEPYLLSIAMQQHQDGKLPDTLDEPKLIGESIKSKSARAVDVEGHSVINMLSKLAKAMLEHDAPLPETIALDSWGISKQQGVPGSMFDAALLANCTNEALSPCVDFYNGRDRDFAIACLASEWHRKISRGEELSSEFTGATRTIAGKDALRWFFRQQSYVETFQRPDGSLPRFNDANVQRLFLSGLCDIVSRFGPPNDMWLKYAIDLSDTCEIEVAIEAVRLGALAADDRDELLGAFSDSTSLRDFTIAILSLGDDYPFAADSPGSVVLEAFQSLHYDSCPTEELEESEITGILGDLLCHESRTVRRRAAECFGFVDPLLFLRALPGAVTLNGNQDSTRATDLQYGIENATSQLFEGFYGSYCPGMLNYLKDEPEALLREYEKLNPILMPVLDMYPQSVTKGLADLLMDLEPEDSIEEHNDPPDRTSPRNMTFPFLDDGDKS